MNKEFGDKKSFVVGLIIIFALLFFCVSVSIYQMLLPKVVISPLGPFPKNPQITGIIP